MTREEAKEWALLINAYASGEEIEALVHGKWAPLTCPDFSWELTSYRVKPKPVVRWSLFYPNDPHLTLNEFEQSARQRHTAAVANTPADQPKPKLVKVTLEEMP